MSVPGALPFFAFLTDFFTFWYILLLCWCVHFVFLCLSHCLLHGRPLINLKSIPSILTLRFFYRKVYVLLCLLFASFYFAFHCFSWFLEVFFHAFFLVWMIFLNSSLHQLFIFLKPPFVTIPHDLIAYQLCI